MAVPFNMPEDQNEVEVLLVQLQTLLNRLQVAVRRSQQLAQQPTASTSTSSIPNSNRVRTSSSGRSRNLEPTPESSSTVQNFVLPDLLSNMLVPGSPSQASQCPLTAISVRSPRRRTNSESLNPDETKISITAIVKQDYFAQDWNNKIDSVNGEGSKELETDGLLSKIMPASVSSCSLMTAMICFVGWHIFRAR